jgi:multisubunit Na+/H+ antiporter MnhB subunit
MTPLLAAFDVALAVLLVGLALVVLLTADLFRAVVLFIAFGLLMSLAWARLHALDIALAEAAIGAGLTGALFLNALAHRQARTLHPAPGSRAADGEGRGESRFRYPARQMVLRRLLLPVLALGLVMVAVLALAAGRQDRVDLAVQVGEMMSRSGVDHPVTAVLLNFRAYDTLLEVAVLVLAVSGAWALGPSPVRARQQVPGPVLLALVRVLVPVIVLVGAYMLWAGTTAPGGAFQAGAILAAAGVLLVVAGALRPFDQHRRRLRVVIAGGFVVFLVIGVAVMLPGARFLEYPSRWAGALIFLIEALLALSIALILAVLFAGDRTEFDHGRSGGPAADRQR